jgi:hypothetical protein
VKLYLFVILRRHNAVTHFLVPRNPGENQLRQGYATGWGVWGVGQRVVGFLANSVRSSGTGLKLEVLPSV